MDLKRVDEGRAAMRLGGVVGFGVEVERESSTETVPEVQ